MFSNVVSIGELIEVDCGVTLGNVTATEQCAEVRLQVNNVDFPISNSLINTRTPFFKFPVTFKTHHEYRCIIYFQSNDPICTTTDDSFNGPMYKVYRKHLIIGMNYYNRCNANYCWFSAAHEKKLLLFLVLPTDFSASLLQTVHCTIPIT